MSWYRDHLIGCNDEKVGCSDFGDMSDSLKLLLPRGENIRGARKQRLPPIHNLAQMGAVTKSIGDSWTYFFLDFESFSSVLL